MLAAISAFASTIPGFDRRLALLPLPALGLWIATLGEACRQAWLADGGFGGRLAPDWDCFPQMLLAGAIPALAMLLMLRRGAALAPRVTALLGALASASLGSLGLKLFHMHDASIAVLAWQLGGMGIASTLAPFAGGALRSASSH
jgi:hypothetical protein